MPTVRASRQLALQANKFRPLLVEECPWSVGVQPVRQRRPRRIVVRVLDDRTQERDVVGVLVRGHGADAFTTPRGPVTVPVPHWHRGLAFRADAAGLESPQRIVPSWQPPPLSGGEGPKC